MTETRPASSITLSTSAFPSPERSGAQVMCEALVRENVEVMFGIPGENIGNPAERASDLVTRT